MSVPVTLIMPGTEAPALADFQADNTALAPRTLDMLNFYQSWSEPLWYGAYATWCTELGAGMYISWQPTTTLGSITAGSQDSVLESAGSYISGFSGTVWLRPAFEFNGNWNVYGYEQETAASFVSGWQYMVNMVRANGGSSAKWIWSPNIWGFGGPTCDPTVADSSGVNWYPGDSFVDYIALDGYMTKESSQLYTPSQLFSANYTALTGLTAKPFGIGEVGCSNDTTRLASIGGKAGWLQQLFTFAQSLPNLAFMDYFNRDAPADSPNDDFTISSSGSDLAAQAAFVNGVCGYPFRKYSKFAGTGNSRKRLSSLLP